VETQQPAEAEHFYFVDEAGDAVFHDRRGNLIVGQGGCSPILVLGCIETADPKPMRRALAELRPQLAADKYLQAIPSMSKTLRAFHAKDDAPEVRYFVYQAIAKMEFTARFIVARKIERVFRNSFHANENEFYDYLVSLLFEDVLHRHTHNHVYFSQRGARARRCVWRRLCVRVWRDTRRNGISKLKQIFVWRHKHLWVSLAYQSLIT
jgi:hypothetical protein